MIERNRMNGTENRDLRRSTRISLDYRTTVWGLIVCSLYFEHHPTFKSAPFEPVLRWFLNKGVQEHHTFSYWCPRVIVHSLYGFQPIEADTNLKSVDFFFGIFTKTINRRNLTSRRTKCRHKNVLMVLNFSESLSNFKNVKTVFFFFTNTIKKVFKSSTSNVRTRV